MRKLISMLLALLLVALPVLAENWNPYDYTDALNAAGRQYYEDAMKVFYSVYGE